MAQNRQKCFNTGVTIGAIVNFIMNSFMIKFKGCIGAAISSVIAEFAILLFFIFNTKNEVNYVWVFKISIRYAIPSFLIGYLVLYLGKIGPSNIYGVLIQFTVALIVYMLYLLIVKDEMSLWVIKKIKSNLKRGNL